jgi:hypothetical protein
MGFELPFYRLSHVIFGLKPTLRLLAAAAVVMVISAQETYSRKRTPQDKYKVKPKQHSPNETSCAE